jgi:cellulose synthase/poly-beta-1,6-N-acetylglucosamine synthase-like glycosyltransferase
VSKIVDYYTSINPKLIVGPVVYHNEKGFFQKLFSIDFISLVAAGAGSIGANNPFMGNGANLAFNRKVFQEVQDAIPGKDFASGDDVFLIHQISKKFGKESVHFIKDPEVLVKTKPPLNFLQFISQRIRWASKAKGYRTTWSVLVPIVVAMFNLMLTATFVAGFFKTWFFMIFILYILFKFLIDLPLLFNFMGFTDKSQLRHLVLPFEFVYPFYIVVAAFLSIFTGYEWKGRRGLR